MIFMYSKRALRLSLQLQLLFAFSLTLTLLLSACGSGSTPKETLTTNFKDLPPAAQQQLLAQLGINLTPEDFMAKVLMDKAARPSSPPRPGGIVAGNGAGHGG